MKVTLLGTGSAEGMPGLFCRCAMCERVRAAGGKDIRTRSSSLIDGILKIDFPPDILTQSLRTNLDLRSIAAVLFTHGHDDHFSPGELQYRSKYFVDTPIREPLAIFGPRDVIERVRGELDPDLMAFSLHTVAPECAVTVAGYDVYPFAANHDHSRMCLNYILRGPDGASLLYATDTGWYDERTWSLLKPFRLDGVVVECAKREEGGYPGHLSIPEVIRMRRMLVDMGVLAPDAPVVGTHFCHLMNLMHHELEVMFAGSGVTAGYDGATIEIRPSRRP